MPQNQSQNQSSNSQTLVIDAEEFAFETVEQHNGIATVVKFKLDNPDVRSGDVLLVLSGAEIHFHGFIGGIEDGYGPLRFDVTGRSSLRPPHEIFMRRGCAARVANASLTGYRYYR
jgi:hypothetical protein